MSKEFGERLKQALKNAGYSQKSASESLGLSKNAMTNYVGGRIPEAVILYKIAKLCSVSMEWLLTGEDKQAAKNEVNDYKQKGELSTKEVLSNGKRINEGMMKMESLGERIAFLRESRKMSQRQLMEILKFDNLSRYEKNERKPGIDIVIAIAEYFDVSIDWLLTGKERRQDVNLHRFHMQLTPNDVELLAKFYQLSEKDQGKIEGMIDGLLLAAKNESAARQKTEMSSRSRSGNGREEAAAKSETA